MPTLRPWRAVLASLSLLWLPGAARSGPLDLVRGLVPGGAQTAPMHRPLVRLVGLAPGETQAIALLENSPELRQRLLGVLPGGEGYREVLEERGKLLGLRTGVDPLGDLERVGFAFSREEGGKRHVLLQLEYRRDPAPLLRALDADPELGRSIQMPGEAPGRIGTLAFHLLPRSILIASRETLASLREKPAPGASYLPSQAARGKGSAARFFLAWRGPPRPAGGPRGKRAEPTPMDVLARLRVGVLTLDEASLRFRLQGGERQDAEFLADWVAEGLGKALAGPPAPEADSLAELLSPASIGREAARRTLRRFLQGLTVDRGRGSLELACGLGHMPSPGVLGQISGVGVLAAMAIPNFRAARARALQRACYAEQRILTGAAEMHAMDTGEVVRELTPELLQRWRKEGYLFRQPSDPGQGEDSAANFYMRRDVPGQVACKVHGSFDGKIEGTGGDPLPPDPRLARASGLLGKLGSGLLTRFRGSAPGAGSDSAPEPRLDERRICFQRQAVLGGVMAMWQLDRGEPVEALSTELIEAWVREKYLPGFLDHPGSPPGELAGFHVDPKAPGGISCSIHGPRP